jgi:hypothetical protein
MTEIKLDVDERIKMLRFLWSTGWPRYKKPSLTDSRLIEEVNKLGYTNER